MDAYHTNIFPILNLDEIKSDYRLFSLEGLHSNLEDYDKNIQLIINKLSYTLRHPVTIIKKDGKPLLVVKDDPIVLDKIPTKVNVVRNIIELLKLEKTLTLDYNNYDDETKEICKRFLRFDIQSQLFNHPRLWTPSSGQPFFSYNATNRNNIGIYNGFSVRVVEIQNGFGICLDPTKKYVSLKPLKSDLSRNDFNRNKLKGRHFIYHFPTNWYEIKVEDYSDYSVSKTFYYRGQRETNLIDDLRNISRKPHPEELAKIKDNASVLLYRSNNNEMYSAPATLLYQVYDTEDKEIRGLHTMSILEPYQRRSSTEISRKFMSNIKFGNMTLSVSKDPILSKKKIFSVPDLEFGNCTTLSVNNTPGSLITTIENLGKTRKNLLENPSVGFYSRGSFDNQFIVIPNSINDSVGNKFIEDLKLKVNSMYPTSDGYNPLLLTYEERELKPYIELGLEIVKLIKENTKGTSYGVVMIPQYSKGKRKHDQLAALITRELLDEDIHVGIIHSTIASKSYEYKKDNNGNPSYVVKSDFRRKLEGYLSNVTINKILLTNNKWPFVLSTPLNADLTIGIDVKHNTAGFTFIDKYCKSLRTFSKKTTQKEKLSRKQVYTTLKVIIEEEVSFGNSNLKNIVIHRDGRIFESEKTGIYEAINDLKNKNVLPQDVEITILEIPKNSSIRFRLYDVIKDIKYGEKTYNPQIGSYFLLNENEAFICTTGREFVRKGTTNPLYVKYNEGGMNFVDALQDLYSLTVLAYSKPDDCSKYPLSIKMTDRVLSDVASEYDEEELNLLLEEQNIITNE